MSRTRIALVTARPHPDVGVDRDLPLLQQALDAEGAEAVAVCWDDAEADWEAFDLAVVRSTWDYSWRPAEFLAWGDRCGSLTSLANRPSVLRWNADKRYLGMLADLGVPVVPTRYLMPGSPADLPHSHEYVIKPTSGAGARFAARYRPEDHDEALRHLERMQAEGLTAMVQPYMRRIDTTGERALIFVAGRFLHAVRKNAVLSPGTPYDQRKVPHPGLRPWSPTRAELAAAERALAAVPGSRDLLYARVDLVEDEDGNPQVMEVELVEPNLFLTVHPGSLPAVADAIVRTATGAR
ncbi:ATP-grasp domain-containing protein [Streptomyces sp. 7N604]|uniref:ATP-grasp domain-containing protein n=1 Tax=Streptomyces sp. 7N604 TaxID=3457415 RepID=UPI003FD5A246